MKTTGPDPETSNAKIVVAKAVRLYVVTLLALSAIGWSVVGLRGPVLHESYPHNSLFVQRKYRFSDFTDFSVRVAHYGEADMLSRTDIPVRFPYPVPTIYPFLFFVRFFANPLGAYIGFVLTSFGLAALGLSLAARKLTHRLLYQAAIWLTLLLAFPLLFLIDRGNIEAVVWTCILVGIVAYVKDWAKIAAIFFACAASMKIYPALLLLLFLPRRQYLAIVIALLLAPTLFIASLAGVGPTIQKAAQSSSEGAAYLKENFIVTNPAPGFDHSLFGLIRQAISVYEYERHNTADTRTQVSGALQIYSVVVPMAALLLYWFRLRRMPILNQFMAFIVMYILLPYVSYEYTLVHLYLAWAAFLLFILEDVSVGRVMVKSKAIVILLLSSGVIFTPQSYLGVGHSFQFGGQVKTIFLLVILLITVLVRMPSTLFADLTKTSQA